MNATPVVDVLADIGVMRFEIPALSPDINCIENIFDAMHK